MLALFLKILKEDNVFLSGGAGTGKSYLCTKVIKSYKDEGKSVAVLSSSALSALNIGGFTLHSFLGLGICNDLEDLAAYDKRRKSALKGIYKSLRKCDLVIIDEISMISSKVFDMITYRLKFSGFSGRLLIVGDFCQLPPVVKKDELKASLLDSLYAFETSAWKDFDLKYVRLRLPKRSLDLEFYDHLRHLRFGVCNEKILNYFKSLCIKPSQVKDDYTILCALNATANKVNAKKLANLPSKEVHFKAISIKNDPSLHADALSRWIKGISVSEDLVLKKGAKVIFCINNKEEGYVNGEQGVVVGFDTQGGDERILIQKQDDTISLSRYEYKLSVSMGDEEYTRASFFQFPVKLAYAITMHKAQGMSINKLIIDIDKVFENSQLYVALSRSSDPKKLGLLYSGTKDFKVFFKEILKFNQTVYDFYKKSSFIDLEEASLT